MKKFALIFCSLLLAQATFAALDRDYFDYSTSPEFQSIPTKEYQRPTVQNMNAQTDVTSEEEIITQTKTAKKGKRRIRFGNQGSSWINTYWNFGQPVYGETGRF